METGQNLFLLFLLIIIILLLLLLFLLLLLLLLVGGLEHVFFHILGMSSSQLTFIFVQRGRLKPPTR